jgi:hypothetical protein
VVPLQQRRTAATAAIATILWVKLRSNQLDYCVSSTTQRLESSCDFSTYMSQAEPDLPAKAASLLRNFDVFPKVADEARARSASGGMTTVAVALCILLLVFSEARLYASVRTDQTLEVDVTRGGKVAVDFNITFDYLPCSLMSVDSMDISGTCTVYNAASCTLS